MEQLGAGDGGCVLHVLHVEKSDVIFATSAGQHVHLSPSASSRPFAFVLQQGFYPNAPNATRQQMCSQYTVHVNSTGLSPLIVSNVERIGISCTYMKS